MGCLHLVYFCQNAQMYMWESFSSEQYVELMLGENMIAYKEKYGETWSTKSSILFLFLRLV